MRFGFDILVLLLLVACFACKVVVADDEDEGVTPKIVGGDRAMNGEYPFFVLWNGCGASLIHPDIALSAGHVSYIRSFFLI